jgi:hypothetical protein
MSFWSRSDGVRNPAKIPHQYLFEFTHGKRKTNLLHQPFEFRDLMKDFSFESISMYVRLIDDCVFEADSR